MFNFVFGDNPMGEKVWTLQEKLKGRTVTGEILGSNYGGWGFNRYWDVTIDPGSARHRTPAEANALNDIQLINNPFFLPGPQDLHNNNGSTYAAQHRNTLLAEMIPARTRPAGSNRIENSYFIPPNGGERNFNLTSTEFQNGWPEERLNNAQDGNRWLHSDINNVAFPFTWKVFDKFKTLGGLDQ